MAKKIYVLAIVLCVSSILSVCCGGGGRSPQDIPGALYDAMLKGDADTLRELTTGNTTKEAIEGIDEVKNLNITISDLKVLEVNEIEQDKTNVRVEFIHEENPEEGKYRKKHHEQVFRLIKIEGRWVVDEVDDVSTEDITGQ